MTKRTWIKIHNGLTNDPKHRLAMGNRIWLFMWYCDHADFETGVVYGCTDAGVAIEMNMKPRTVEDQRQGLEKSGYIKCHQGFQCQDIRIMRWRNPKEVSPEQVNIPGHENTWYDNRRTHGNTFSVPIPAETSVPLPIDHNQSESLKSIREFWLKEIKTPEPGGVFFEKLDYRIETHGLEKVQRCLLKANQYGKAHNLPYLDKIIAEDKPENGNGIRVDTRPVVTATPASKRKDYTNG